MTQSNPEQEKVERDFNVFEDRSRDVILDMYEDDIACDMDCKHCSSLERAECVGEMKSALLVVIQKLNQIYADFNTFSRKIYKVLKLGDLIEHIKAEREEQAKGTSEIGQIFS